ncbi:type II secretion system protein [Acetobacterium woodii]|uniref:Prepilin-type N-terminal cleavage/methylation domain-containing protein n=1 Tax=Acetobacterium woodii (strain ATCC 29683 / DSM 1030 / JCM 2381 / KCTC 1655 / WB1) TaxID=931626 RepID=H6LFR4_ACEWD|nr:type II secretion system protein [Acetobacterium woodii]AFA47009.1 hypothetical protein containing prepillin-type cleavage and methylation domain [Acetobacterium woodii DSM 1030]
MELFNRIKKNKKGFTLVEIIVVLVILAILAAFTIPTMLGFVNDAKGKALIAEAREVYVASQAIATEYIASGKTIAATDLNSKSVEPATAGASLQMQTYLKNDLKISDVDITKAADSPKPSDDDAAWLVTFDGTTGKVTEIYFVKDGYSITISEPAGTSTVVKL